MDCKSCSSWIVNSCSPFFRSADPLRSVPGLVWVISPLNYGPGHIFLSFCVGLGRFLRFSSCLHPPAQWRAVVWVIRPLNCGTGLSIFRVRFFFVLPIYPLSRPGAIWVFFATPTVAQDCVTFCFFLFGCIVSPRLPSPRLWRYFGFRFSVRTFSPRSPF